MYQCEYRILEMNQYSTYWILKMDQYEYCFGRITSTNTGFWRFTSTNTGFRKFYQHEHWIFENLTSTNTGFFENLPARTLDLENFTGFWKSYQHEHWMFEKFYPTDSDERFSVFILTMT